MARAHVLIRAEGRGAAEDDAAAARDRLPHERERETLFAELTGHGFVASMACAGTAALLALGGALDGLVAYERTATLALLAAVVVACLHAVRGGRALSAAALESGGVIWRHRAMLFVLGLCCAAASPAWAQQGAAASTVSVGMLMLIGGLGASSATADRCSLLLWVGSALGLPLALCLSANTDQGRNAAWMLAICIVVILGLAGRVRRLVRRAWRVRQENDQLVAQLRQQVALVEAANNEKTRFLGAASHDLRQPMHALGLFAAALEKELRGSKHHAKVISMSRAVDALEDSFGAMLDVSKLDAGIVQPNLQTFPIRDVFRRLHMHCAGQAEEKGLSLRFKPGGKLVTSDPQLLERILANLVHNAIRYTNEGGVIAVARTRRDRTSIEVWDTGAGIAAEELPQIFNEFYQVENQGRDRSQGLGMGLSIVKRLVLLLGYELEVALTPGRGSVFRVLLPPTQLEEMPSMVQGADTIPAAPEEGRTVLVIDDEAAVRAGMDELLRGWGYTVLLAGTIAEARAAVLGHNGLIDVVVSDLRLANSEDGLHAIDEVRAHVWRAAAGAADHWGYLAGGGEAGACGWASGAVQAGAGARSVRCFASYALSAFLLLCARARLGAGRCGAADATPAARVRCGARDSVAPCNSLRSLRSLPSNRHGEYVYEAREYTRRPNPSAPRRSHTQPRTGRPQALRGDERAWGEWSGKPRASSPRLAGAPKARVCARAGLDARLVCYSPNRTVGALRKAVGGCAVACLCGGEERRDSVGACTHALRELTHRVCPNETSAASEVSYAVRPNPEHRSAVGAPLAPTAAVARRRAPAHGFAPPPHRTRK